MTHSSFAHAYSQYASDVKGVLLSHTQSVIYRLEMTQYSIAKSDL